MSDDKDIRFTQTYTTNKTDEYMMLESIRDTLKSVVWLLVALSIIVLVVGCGG